LHGGFDGAVSGHERDFGAGQKFLDLLQEFQARHVGHDHVAEDHVYGLFFEQGEGGFSAIGFKADETQSLTDGHAKFANALLVVDHEQTDAEFFLAERGFAE